MRRPSAGWLLIAPLVLLFCAGPARAEEREAAPNTGRASATKLFRGVANVATGWIEVPKQMSLEWEEKGAKRGLTVGLARGLGWAVGRTAVGLYEAVTFPLKGQGDYAPIMTPEYVLSDQENKEPTGQ